jgi:hypothetical protein
MANTKITKREVITMMLNEEVINSNETYVAYLTHELELLNNKAASRKSGKPTKTQEMNEELKGIVLNVCDAEGATITELQNKDEQLKGYSNQKLTAIVKMLEADGLVVRYKEGRRTLVKLV